MWLSLLGTPSLRGGWRPFKIDASGLEGAVGNVTVYVHSYREFTAGWMKLRESDVQGTALAMDDT